MTIDNHRLDLITFAIPHEAKDYVLTVEFKEREEVLIQQSPSNRVSLTVSYVESTMSAELRHCGDKPRQTRPGERHFKQFRTYINRTHESE